MSEQPATLPYKRMLFHVHTRPRSHDATMRPEEAVRRAEFLGCDMIVFCEHDDFWAPAALEDLKEMTGTRLTLVGARELAGRDAHIIVIGQIDVWDEVARAFPKIGGLVRRHGGATVLAHPFNKRFQIPPSLAADWEVDALEIRNGRGQPAPAGARTQSINLGLAILGGADAHHLSDNPRDGVNNMESWVETEAQLIRAIRMKRVWPKARTPEHP